MSLFLDACMLEAAEIICPMFIVLPFLFHIYHTVGVKKITMVTTYKLLKATYITY